MIRVFALENVKYKDFLGGQTIYDISTACIEVHRVAPQCKS